MKSKEDKDLIVKSEGTFVFRGKKIKYALLENGYAIIAVTSLLMLLRAKEKDFNDFPSFRRFKSQNKWNNGLYLDEVIEILISIISGNESEDLIKSAKDLLTDLSLNALKSFTGEEDIIVDEEPKQEPTFNQLLGALMKVPPPKKG
ncbi:hypothetical protein [Pedobacter duraquae]|uniref:Uncharacterized protein n=1 Tax=Pedobacter duraquae TaxID=425511 RepID=A0A4R6INL7_9SPHI|nr:hypothetical protein [Pedobacter duraquae]TDO23757.1 hypothetical protein CLV32_0042 [Pedobacter duraquae]